MNTAAGDARLAVDIGGTFTDVALERGGERWTTKVLTTARPEEAVIAGIKDALEKSGIAADAVSLLIHGTTLATNAIIERKGAVTALLTTEGFRDVIQIGYESRHDQYDIMIEKAVPLVPRYLRLPVPERSDVHGRVLTDLDEARVRAHVPALIEAGVESVAIGYLHSYANPGHEQRTGEILRAELPALSITLSSDVCPEVREYERLTTATANAYVRPLMEGYLGRVASALEDIGCHCPMLMMTSGGGLMTLETAKQQPIRLVESGPAGGAILAQRIAQAADLDKVISFDMGGTTAKICVIDDFEPRKNREFEIDRQARFMKGSGLPVRIPVIEMVEIGAGGGSIARVDGMRRITVGPDSAGAEPGPAAYGQGGRDATITDADLILGKIDPAAFAGGKVSLERDLAAAAITDAVAQALDLDVTTAAYGICEIVDETMSNAARVHAVEQGKVASEHTLIAFGGAAPLHVGRIAEKLGIDRIIVPVNAGVGSAIGFLAAPIAFEVVRSRNMRLKHFDADLANEIIQAMLAEAEAVVRAGAPEEELERRVSAFMRYFGQGHEIVVTLPLKPFTADDRETLQAGFDKEYQRLYQRSLPNAEVEILTWAVTVTTLAQAPEKIGSVAPVDAAAPIGERALYDPERQGTIQVPVYWREDLAPGAHLAGPAIIAEDETSTLVTGRFDASIAAGGNIVLDRKTETKT